MPVVAKPTLLQAVKELYSSIGGGLPLLFLDEAPEGQGYPRSLLHDLGQRTGDELNADGTAVTAEHDFEIEIIVQNNSDTAETLALLVLAAFIPSAIQLTFDSNAALENDRRTVRTEMIVGQYPQDQPLYRTRIGYSCRYGTDY